MACATKGGVPMEKAMCFGTAVAVAEQGRSAASSESCTSCMPYHVVFAAVVAFSYMDRERVCNPFRRRKLARTLKP